MSAPQDIYKMIIESIRRADQPGRLLERFLTGMQNAWDQIYDKILTQPEIVDWEESPAESLRWLLWHVGFTSEFDFLFGPDGLTETDQRKLASVAMTLWKQRFTQRGVEDLIRFFFGREILFFDYFFFRWVLDENFVDGIWDGLDIWNIQPGGTDLDEYWNLIMIEDLDQDLNQVLLRQMLELERPSSERFYVILLSLIEQFDTLDRWTHWTGGTGQTLEDGTFKITADGKWYFAPASALNWGDSTVTAKVQFNGTVAATGVAQIFVRLNGAQDRYYRIDFKKDGIDIYRYDGALNLIASTVVDLDTNVWYSFGVHMEQKQPGLGGERAVVRAFVDDVLKLEHEDSNLSVNQGTVAVGSGSTANDIWFDWIRVQPIPAITMEITP